ncbi:MAG: RNA polymerase sigma factor [Lentisphaeria bacterium]|nr:RNA polymerase sigma factor [Lentisphaeria bacterium]
MTGNIENIERFEALSNCGGLDCSTRSDWELVKLMCDGVGEAFTEIVARYETKLIAYSRRYVGSLDLAKDICQEVFLKLIDKPPTTLQNDNLGPWLFRVSHNLAIDIIRRRKFELTGETLPEMTCGHRSPLSSLAHENDTEMLRSLIAKLPDDFRQVVELRIYGEMAFKDIAETLEIPQGTALWRMHEAINQLRSLWRRYES